jgi:hypothetical protein
MKLEIPRKKRKPITFTYTNIYFNALKGQLKMQWRG